MENKKAQSVQECNIMWTAYNEEFTLESSYDAVLEAIDFAINKFKKQYLIDIKFKGLICHNGCTDNTATIAKKIKKESDKDKFPIDVIKSKKGMVIAQQKCIDHLRENGKDNHPILFIDADAKMNKDVIFILLDQLIKHPKLNAVGVHPIPEKYKGINLYKRFLYNTLNFRAIHPLSESAMHYAPEYHPYAETSPQPIGADFEKKSKIYFHGRCFMLRNLNIWDVPKDTLVEDTYLDRSINDKYGPGTIRVMYHANVRFIPITSLYKYYKTYTRTYMALNELERKYPRFNHIRKFSKTTVDKEYFKKIGFIDKIYFHSHNIVKWFIYNMYKRKIILVPKKNMWNYNSKKLE